MIILAAMAVVIAVISAVLLLRPDVPPEVVVGDFVPPEFDAAAVEGLPAVGMPDMYGTLVLNESTAVSMYSAPIVCEDKVQVFFTSDATNTVWVRLRLMDQKGTVLGQTGLLKLGEYVEYLALDTLPGNTPVIAKILTYQPETYYSMGSASAEMELQNQ